MTLKPLYPLLFIALALLSRATDRDLIKFVYCLYYSTASCAILKHSLLKKILFEPNLPDPFSSQRSKLCYVLIQTIEPVWCDWPLAGRDLAWEQAPHLGKKVTRPQSSFIISIWQRRLQRSL